MRFKWPVITLMMVLLSAAAGLEAATVENSLAGLQLSPGAAGSANFILAAGAARKGDVSLTIERDGGAATGGQWVFTASDGSSLRGVVSGGDITMRNAAQVRAADVVLTITAGSGEWSGVTAGSGRLTLESDGNGARVQGTWSLTFEGGAQ